MTVVGSSISDKVQLDPLANDSVVSERLSIIIILIFGTQKGPVTFPSPTGISAPKAFHSFVYFMLGTHFLTLVDNLYTDTTLVTSVLAALGSDSLSLLNSKTSSNLGLHGPISRCLKTSRRQPDQGSVGTVWDCMHTLTHWLTSTSILTEGGHQNTTPKRVAPHTPATHNQSSQQLL
jgi:hypothetical protein